jgi:hypothetical protein
MDTLRGDRLEWFAVCRLRWLLAVGNSSLLLFEIEES